MTQLTGAQARIVDPILTTRARGIKQPLTRGEKLFPRVKVKVYAGNVTQFGKEHFFPTSSRRAAGSDIKRVQAGYVGIAYSLRSRALIASAPDELQRDGLGAANVNLLNSSISVARGKQSTELEQEQATLARNPANYGGNVLVLSGASRWTQTTSTPIADVRAAKNSVLKKCGMKPNVGLLGPNAFNAAIEHASVRDYLKHTSAEVITEELLAKVFQLDALYVAEAMVGDESTGNLDFIWGNDVILAYVPQAPGEGTDRDLAEPSYGYTYEIDGMPTVSVPRYNENNASWEVTVRDDCEAMPTGMSAGYLLQNAGA